MPGIPREPPTRDLNSYFLGGGRITAVVRQNRNTQLINDTPSGPTNNSPHDPSYRLSPQVIVAFSFGVVFVVTLLLLAMFFPKPTPFQYNVFRIVLSIATAGVAAMIPGFINLSLSPSAQLAIRAGGALAVFVIVYFFNPAQLAIEPPVDPDNVSVSTTIQEYHIIRGTTAEPLLLDAVVGPKADIGQLQKQVWEAVLPQIDPDKRHVDLKVAVDGNQLRVSHYIEVWLPGVGVQGFGAARKILEADADRPIDLDKLFAGEYPGSYFRQDDKMTLGIEGQFGRFETEQIIIYKLNTGYSLNADAVSATTALTLRRRPVTVLVDSFQAADRSSGVGENIALQFQQYLRAQIMKQDNVKLSPHSRTELQAVHDEVKGLPLGMPFKGFTISEYNVDFIISGSITLQ